LGLLIGDRQIGELFGSRMAPVVHQTLFLFSFHLLPQFYVVYANN